MSITIHQVRTIGYPYGDQKSYCVFRFESNMLSKGFQNLIQVVKNRIIFLRTDLDFDLVSLIDRSLNFIKIGLLVLEILFKSGEISKSFIQICQN